MNYAFFLKVYSGAIIQIYKNVRTITLLFICIKLT